MTQKLPQLTARELIAVGRWNDGQWKVADRFRRADRIEHRAGRQAMLLRNECRGESQKEEYG